MASSSGGTLASDNQKYRGNKWEKKISFVRTLFVFQKDEVKRVRQI